MGVLCLSLLWYTLLCVLSSFAVILAGCFAFIVLRMSCYCKCSVALPNGAVCRSALCDCGISWSYSLTFLWNRADPNLWWNASLSGISSGSSLFAKVHVYQYTMRQYVYLVVNPITVHSYGILFNCTTAGHASDSMTALTYRFHPLAVAKCFFGWVHHGSIWGFLALAICRSWDLSFASS